LPALGYKPLKLVDGDQLGAPRQLDRLDVREEAAEGGAADAERLGSLAASVGQPLMHGRRHPCVLAARPPASPRVSLLHLGGMPWARIGERVGHDDLVTTARTYTHVVADERELDYAELLPR
jgi:hypothetical protein